MTRSRLAGSELRGVDSPSYLPLHLRTRGACMKSSRRQKPRNQGGAPLRTGSRCPHTLLVAMRHGSRTGRRARRGQGADWQRPFVRGRHQPAPWRNPPPHWHAGVSPARSAPACLSDPSRGYGRSTAEETLGADPASWRRPVSATLRRVRLVCVVNRVRGRADCARARGSGRVTTFTTTARSKQ